MPFAIFLLILAIYWFFSLSTFTLAVMLSVFLAFRVLKIAGSPSPREVIRHHKMIADIIEKPASTANQINLLLGVIMIMTIWLVYLNS